MGNSHFPTTKLDTLSRWLRERFRSPIDIHVSPAWRVSIWSISFLISASCADFSALTFPLTVAREDAKCLHSSHAFLYACQSGRVSSLPTLYASSSLVVRKALIMLAISFS